MEECTFQPKINEQGPKTIKTANMLNVNRRNSADQSNYVKENLYKPNVKERDKSPIELEYEKQKSECLFKPTFFAKNYKPIKKSPV